MMKLNQLTDDANQAVRFMKREIAHICAACKDRCAGSESEAKAGEYMARLLKKQCGCDIVSVEHYSHHPRAFYGFLYLSGIFAILGAVGFFWSPWVSVVFDVGALLVMIYEFVFYHEAIDGIFPVAEGTNVVGVRKCAGELKQRVFFNGHIDAAWEWRFKYHFGHFVYSMHIVLSAVGILYTLTVAVVALCSNAVGGTIAAYAGLLFVPLWIALFFMCDYNRIVDGANDNLSGCFMGIGLLKSLEAHGIDLEHTEVGVILTGGEEVGLRGAKAWSKAHEGEYRDVPTFIYVFDTIHDPNELMVNFKDLNNNVKSDVEMGNMFLEAARQQGLPCKSGIVPMFGGSTDSAAFTQGGFRSIGITGLSHNLPDFYHTRKDTAEHLNDVGLENCYRICVQLLKNIEVNLCSSR